jgi:hypothetical protein
VDDVHVDIKKAISRSQEGCLGGQDQANWSLGSVQDLKYHLQCMACCPRGVVVDKDVHVRCHPHTRDPGHDR